MHEVTQVTISSGDRMASSDIAPSPPAKSGLHRKLVLQGLLLGGLVYVSFFNYLLFHSLAELYSIAIACGTFMIAWNARRHYHNDYLFFIGIAYLFVAFFDTLHMLGYHGMTVFRDIPGYNLGPQLWLVARTMEACTLVVAPWFIQRPLDRWRAVSVYALCSVVALWTIFGVRIFPVCFTPERGLTTFKIVSEYVIIALLLLALVVLARHREQLDRQVYRLLLGSTWLTIASEVCFTLYVSHYGPSNLFGHVFKIISFTLIYFAIIDTALNRPFALLFRDLKQREEAMLAAQRAAKQGSWSWRIGAPTMAWTEGVYQQLGLSEQQTVANFENMLAAVHAEDRGTLRQVIEKSAEEQRPFKIEVRCGGDETRYLLVEGACEREENGQPVLVGVVQDVTERIAAEKLRDAIDEITRHDLRSPLTPIIALPELLVARGGLTEYQSEMLHDIRSCGLKMLDMINGSLTLYKIERGTYQLRPEYFDLAGELRELLREVAGKAAPRQVRILLLHQGETLGEMDPFIVYGEKLLCYTLFANLVNNAIEASPENGQVTIDLQQAADRWLIAVHNDGEVPEAIRQRFFEKYATHGKLHGTGIGTYSALMVARAHGGTLRLATGAATGTTLTVELPRPEGLRQAR